MAGLLWWTILCAKDWFPSSGQKLESLRAELSSGFRHDYESFLQGVGQTLLASLTSKLRSGGGRSTRREGFARATIEPLS
jgi:hypothetical protein